MRCKVSRGWRAVFWRKSWKNAGMRRVRQELRMGGRYFDPLERMGVFGVHTLWPAVFMGGLQSPSTPSPPVPGNGTRLTLSQQLHALAQGTPEGGWTLGELMEALGARASALLVIVCALPFCAPVTIPGLSTPFGLVIFLLSLRYALGLPPWLPQRLRKVTLPPKGLVKILEAGSRVIGWIERRMRRRWLFLVMPRWKLRMHAVVIMLSALVLMLPLPPVPPFSNTLPALAIVVMAMSTLERDGKGITTGYGIFVGMIIYFALWAKVLAAAFVRIAERLGF